MIPFGNHLKKLRKEIGWSQEQLARKLGTKRTNVCAFEAGRSYPRLSTFFKICDIFGTDRVMEFQKQSAK